MAAAAAAAPVVPHSRASRMLEGAVERRNARDQTVYDVACLDVLVTAHMSVKGLVADAVAAGVGAVVVAAEASGM